MCIGIMAAMPEEIKGLWHDLENRTEIELGQRTYYRGRYAEHDVVVVFSRWGKVAAAITATTLIQEFHITHLLFTGVAGALHPELQQGDLVLGQRLVQYDMDARPLMPQFEIPLLAKTYFEADTHLLTVALESIQSVQTELQTLHPQHNIPQCLIGDIGSGDRFVGTNELRENILSSLPNLLCVEMEGAAVAQVCYEYNIPNLIIRTISDAANDNAASDFPHFLEHIAGPYARLILEQILRKL